MEKLCPLSFASSNLDNTCVKERCAWWVVYFKGTDREFSECVMCALSHLYDMPIMLDGR